MECMNYLQGLLKTVLKDDELHIAQNELIISEAIERLPTDVQTDEIKKLRERFTLFKSEEQSEEDLLKMLDSNVIIEVILRWSFLLIFKRRKRIRRKKSRILRMIKCTHGKRKERIQLIK